MATEELTTMNMPIEDVYHDYKLVADSIVDDKSFQEADTGILLSNLYDVVKALEKQIPKQVIHYHHCPQCDAGLPTEGITEDYCKCCFKWKYCPNCGQAIKWK